MASVLRLDCEAVVHELSVAQGLIEVACEAAAQEGVARVEALRIRIGALAGVVKEALVFSFELAAAGTACEGARLDIEDVAVTARCPRCDSPQPIADLSFFACPVCGTPVAELLSGRELELVSLEVEAHAAAHT